MLTPQANPPAPNLEIDKWVQGTPSNITQEKGNVILIFVFQINCPGCFLYGIPEILDVFEKLQGQAFKIWGLATAFEDFSKNNLRNLEKLLKNKEVFGETFEVLDQKEMLEQGKLPYIIPFPVAWDKIEKFEEGIEDSTEKILQRDIADFEKYSESSKITIRRQIRSYLKNKRFYAKTFERYELQGAPSSLLLDKQGCLRYKFFGAGHDLFNYAQNLLNE